jgi:hypothetical protein
MDFLLPIFLIAGLVWLAGFALSGQILIGCALFLFATSCLGHEFWNTNLGTQVTIDRLWMIGLVGIAILQRCLGHAQPKPWTKLEWTIVAFIGLLIVHCFFQADANEKGKMSGSPVWHLVIGYLYPVFLYFIARQATLTEQRVYAVHLFLILFGLYLGITGILEMTKQWSLVWPRYIADEKVGLHYGRARGPMVQSVSYGFYLSVCLLATILAFFRWNIKGKIVALPIAGIILVAAFLTHTRSVWMGTALVLMLVTIFCLKGSFRRLVITVALVGGIGIVATKFDSIMGFQREGTVEDTKSSAECRGAFAAVSWYMFLDRPVFGFGFGNFPEEKMSYLTMLLGTDMIADQIRPLIHHNTYLDLLTELGLIGLSLYLGMMYCWGRNAWQLIAANPQPNWFRWQGILVLGTLGSYAIQMIFHEVTFTSIDNSLMYLMAGLAAGMVPLMQNSVRQGRSTDALILRDWIGTAPQQPIAQPITSGRRASDRQ